MTCGSAICILSYPVHADIFPKSIALCNTQSLIPALGGVERVVGKKSYCHRPSNRWCHAVVRIFSGNRRRPFLRGPGSVHKLPQQQKRIPGSKIAPDVSEFFRFIVA